MPAGTRRRSRCPCRACSRPLRAWPASSPCRGARRLRLRQIEFLPLSNQRVLAILVDQRPRGPEQDLERSSRFWCRRAAPRQQLPERSFQRPLASRSSRAAAGRAQDDPRVHERADDRSDRNGQKVVPEGDPPPEFVRRGRNESHGSRATLADVETLKGLFEAFGRQQDILHSAGPEPEGRRRADLHRSGVGL